MTKIEIYTKPGCGGCEKIKEEMKGKELEKSVEYKTIKGKEGKDNLHYLKSLGFTNIPVIKAYNETKEDFLVGYHTIQQIEELAKNINEVA